MKRGILFRGKSVDKNEFVYGLPYSSCYDEEIDQIVVQDYHVDIKTETIGQFTGLTDKNGVKIFENDIIKYYQPYSKKWETNIVLWDNNFSCFGLFEKDNIWCKESDWMKIEELEIIGNIHDA